ncbi:MAG: serine acetyltransferase, partial [Candidatus Glassbacteria bacterium]|nr:serine acetyltransferase [Candidatus Glassbacteria bacterium]
MAVPVVGLGAGGHAKVVIEILRQDSRYELTGLLDPKPELAGKSVSGVPVVGGDDSLAELKARGTNHFFIGLGSVPHPGPRKRLYLLAREKGLKPVSAIHPKSVIAPSADLGPGATVMAAAVINAEACLGENVIVNTGAIIEHDCRIGDHVH